MTRSFKNRLFDNEAARTAAAWVAASYLWLVKRTTRWEVRNGDIPLAFWTRGDPFILAIWHGRLLVAPFAWDYRHTFYMLISRHRDGELITRAVARFGVRSVRGSSKPGEGAPALRQMVRLARQGGYLGITPDGPRGPRMHASEGVVSAARLTGLPVIPLGVATSRRRLLNSWDRFLVPLPFARGAFVWGDPIRIERSADEATCAAAQQQIEAALNAVTATADRLSGHAPVEPAPLATAAAATRS